MISTPSVALQARTDARPVVKITRRAIGAD
jgi:hypothetical protein